jgi:cell division protein FtsQ
MVRPNRKLKSAEERTAARRVFMRRFVWWPARVMLLAGLGVGLGLSANGLYRFFKTSQMLAVRCIEVRGAAQLSVAEILEVAGLEEGQNIFALDIPTIERRLREQAWIRRAHLQRVVPDRLVVEIEEQKPVALVSLEGLYFANADGEIFKRAMPGEVVDLPVVTGMSREQFRNDPARARAQLRMAINLIETATNVPCLKDSQIAEVQIDELLGATVVLDPNAVAFRLGVQRPEERWGLVCRVLNELSTHNLRAQMVLLDHATHPEWATVRLDAQQQSNNEFKSKAVF